MDHLCWAVRSRVLGGLIPLGRNETWLKVKDDGEACEKKKKKEKRRTGPILQLPRPTFQEFVELRSARDRP